MANLYYCELDQEFVGAVQFIGYLYAATRCGITYFDTLYYDGPVEAVEGALERVLTNWPTIKGDITSHTRVVKVYEMFPKNCSEIGQKTA